MVLEHDQLILIPKISFLNFSGINATEPWLGVKAKNEKRVEIIFAKPEGLDLEAWLNVD